MDISFLSKEYEVRRLGEDDVEIIYDLLVHNPLYYEHFPPLITKAAAIDDLKALPPNKTYDDKHYVGFFKEGELIAVMDLIEGYPTEDIAFIGFFMMDIRNQRRGLGKAIIDEAATALKGEGYQAIRLAFVKSNPQSRHFWHKCGFSVYKDTDGTDGNGNRIDLVICERKL